MGGTLKWAGRQPRILSAYFLQHSEKVGINSLDPVQTYHLHTILARFAQPFFAAHLTFAYPSRLPTPQVLAAIDSDSVADVSDALRRLFWGQAPVGYYRASVPWQTVSARLHPRFMKTGF